MSEIISSRNERDEPEGYAQIGRSDVFVTNGGVNLFFENGEDEVEISLSPDEALVLADFIKSHQDVLSTEIARMLSRDSSTKDPVRIRRPGQGPDPIPRNPHYDPSGEG